MSILDTEELRGEIGKTEEFSLHHNRYFVGILDFTLENVCFQYIFNAKWSKLIKNLFSLEFSEFFQKKRNFDYILIVKQRNFQNIGFRIQRNFNFLPRGLHREWNSPAPWKSLKRSLQHLGNPSKEVSSTVKILEEVSSTIKIPPKKSLEEF